MSSRSQRSQRSQRSNKSSSSKKEPSKDPVNPALQDDRTWEKIQLKTFNGWVKAQLGRIGIPFTDLKEFSDGIKLIRLIEVLSGEPQKIPEKKPTIRVKQMINTNAALGYLKLKYNIKLESIGAEDIADGNVKLLMGLTWTLIHDFAIAELSEEAKNSKEALLLWCQKSVNSYKGVKVENFHRSWADGKAFLALVHRQKPSLFDYDAVDKSNVQATLKLAFDTASNEFGIPRILDEADMADPSLRPDEKSMMTYLIEFYRTFARAKQLEAAKRRVTKLVAFTQQNDQLRSEYATKAKDLGSWLKTNTKTLESVKLKDTLEDAREKWAAHVQWKRATKPEGQKNKGDIEAIYQSLTLKLDSNNRPPFKPNKGETPTDFEASWSKLEAAEKATEEKLKAELTRQEILDVLVRRFANRAEKLKSWLSDKEAYISNEPTIDSISAAEVSLTFHDSFDKEYAATEDLVSGIETTIGEIEAQKFKNAKALKKDSASIRKRYNDLAKGQQKRRKFLDDSLAEENEKEELRNKWAKSTQDFIRWSKDMTVFINDHQFGTNLETVQESGLRIEKEHKETDERLFASIDELKKQWKALQKLKTDTNLKYTPITLDDCVSEGSYLSEAIIHRKGAFEKELANQKRNDAKQKELAELKSQYKQLVASQKSEIEKLDGTTKEKMAKLKEIYQGKAVSEKLAEVKAIEDELKSYGAEPSAPSKRDSMLLGVLQTSGSQLDTMYHNYMAALEDEAKREERREAQQAAFKENNEREKLRSEFATLAQSITSWCDHSQDTISDPVSVDSLVDAQALVKELEGIKAKLPELETSMEKANGLNAQMAEKDIKEAYNFTFEALSTKFADTKAKIADRDSVLSSTVEKQTANEALRKEFADSAAGIDADLKAFKAEVERSLSGDLKAQVAEATKAAAGRADVVSKLKALKEIDSRVQDAGIRDIRLTDLSHEGLLAVYEGLEEAAKKKVSTLEQQLISKELGSVKPEQLAEWKDTFEHFDADDSGTLNKAEFRACLQSVGEEVDDEEFEEILKVVDLSGDGLIQFSEFTRMMVKRVEDNDSEEEAVKAWKVLANGADEITEDQTKSHLSDELATWVFGEMKGGNYTKWTKEAYSR